jgi:hypothetical protein
MGKNTGDNYRKGAVRDRSQVLNEKTGQYIKRNTTTGLFVSSKSTPYKGITNESKKDNIYENIINENKKNDRIK